MAHTSLRMTLRISMTGPVSGGCFVDLVINSIFGADLSLYDGIKLTSRLKDFDPNAKLAKLRYQGQNYTVSSQAVQRT